MFLCSCGVASKAEKREGSEELYYFEGLRGFHQANYLYAQECFMRLLKINPQHDAALFYLAKIHLINGKKEEAIRSMRAAAQADTLNFWYQLQIAQMFIVDQQPLLAIQVYEDLLAQYPQKRDIYYDLANLYLSQRNPDKALALLEEIEKIWGTTEETGFYRFNLLLIQGKENEAKTLLEELAQSYPSPRILTIMGDVFIQSENDSLALAYYNEAISQDPNYIPAIFGQAEVFRIRHEYDAFFSKMYLFMDENYVEASLKIDYMDQLLQNRPFAATFLKQIDTLFTKIYQRHQSDTTVVYRYAGFSIQAGLEKRAVDVFQDFVRLYPKERGAWLQYLSLIHYLQYWDRLYEVSQEALQLFPKDLDFMTMSGIAAWQTDHPSLAISIFESTIPMAKNKNDFLSRTWSILGDLYHSEGDPKKSFQSYEKSLKIDPDQIGTLNNYAYFLSLSGEKLQKAYEMSKKTIEAEPKNATYLDTFGWILYKQGRYQEAKAIFRQVLMYGTDVSAEVLDHYAEILFALNEFDMAFMYWEQAKLKVKNPELEKKIEQRKIEMKR